MIRFNFTLGEISKKMNGNYSLNITIDKSEGHKMNKLNKLLLKDKIKVAEIKEYRAKRSLTANSFYWLLIHKVAVKLSTTDEEIHEEMLKSYGTKDYLETTIKIMENMKRAFKFVDVVQERMLNNQEGALYKCIRGSHTYDTKEFSTLLEGIISECKELDIDTMTPQEVEQLMANYKPMEG